MARLRLLNANWYPGAALAASSEALALPVAASAHPDRSYVWRSLAEASAQMIDIDLGAVRAVTCVALANVKLLAGGVVALYQRGDGATPGDATLVATLPAANADRRVTFAFFAQASHRHWQLRWTNPGPVEDYAELGFAYLGTYFEPTVNVTVPMDVAEVDPSIVRQSVDRQRSTVSRTRYTMGQFAWVGLPDADRGDLRALWGTLGSAHPVFAVLDETRSWTAWMLYLQGQITERFREVDGRYDVGLEWEEAT
ncbi:MAG: hypothetical protein Q8L86_10055 [Vicinamibacterales bacterium]|nr:hypothetical protein [Vicinamibacterales bacterium]